MTKRAFIIHGWGGNPREAWMPWLKKELEKKGFTVLAPKMPTPESPKMTSWVKHLAKQAKIVDKDTYFIGHSIGCQTIIRYLASQDKKCGGAVFVAGWFTLTGLETKQEERIAAPWLYNPIDFTKAKKNMNSSVAILSTDDPFVPLAKNRDVFKKILGSKIVIEKKKGHINGEADIKKLPSALKAVMMVKQQ